MKQDDSSPTDDDPSPVPPALASQRRVTRVNLFLEPRRREPVSPLKKDYYTGKSIGYTEHEQNLRMRISGPITITRWDPTSRYTILLARPELPFSPPFREPLADPRNLSQHFLTELCDPPLDPEVDPTYAYLLISSEHDYRSVRMFEGMAEHHPLSLPFPSPGVVPMGPRMNKMTRSLSGVLRVRTNERSSRTMLSYKEQLRKIEDDLGVEKGQEEIRTWKHRPVHPDLVVLTMRMFRHLIRGSLRIVSPPKTELRAPPPPPTTTAAD